MKNMLGKFTAVICGSVLLLAAATVQSLHAEDALPEPEEQRYRIEKTGDTRVCLRYAKVETVSPVAQDSFLFVSAGKYYLNTTQSECFYEENIDINVKFKLRSANLCKNTRMFVYAKRFVTELRSVCTLSDFYEVRLVPLE